MRFNVGVDNLSVVGHVGRLLDSIEVSRPVEVREMTGRRSEVTARITKVKGNADEEMVREGQVWEQDRRGNDRADEAADFRRRRVEPGVIDARRNLSGVCRCWYLQSCIAFHCYLSCCGEQ